MTRVISFTVLVVFWATGCAGDPEPVEALPEVVMPIGVDVLDIPEIVVFVVVFVVALLAELEGQFHDITRTIAKPRVSCWSPSS